MGYTGHIFSGASDADSVRFDFDSLDASPGKLVVPDAHLLFSGHFERTGSDLVISDQLHRVVVPHYFGGEKRPILVSPQGAALDSRVIDALTGHVAYAQAGATAAGVKVVGHVVKMTGSASIVRSGVAIVVNTGDTIYQNDVIQTGSNSTLGLVLDDGSAFNLSANARFMCNDFAYEANSTSNHSFLSLIQGAATFVAGQVAPTGDMEVGTPAAVIGVRGTAVILDISAVDGQVSISVADQQDGQVHSVQVFRCLPSATGLQGVCTAGDPIGTVASNGSTLRLTPGPNFQVTTQETAKTPAQTAQEFNSFQQALSTYDAGKQQFPNLPQHTENTNQNNNTNTATTKTALGSAPAQPLELTSTSVFADTGTTKAVVSGSLIPATLSISTSVSTGAISATTQVASATTTTIIIPYTPLVITSTGGETNQAAQTITGTVDAALVGTTVTLVDTFNGVTTQVGTTTVGAGGVWSASVKLTGDGVHSVTALDPSASSTPAPVVFTLETTPPAVDITSGAGGSVSQATQTISGTVTAAAGEAAVGNTVTLLDTINGVTKQIGTAVVGSGGAWSTDVMLSGGGAHSIVAQDTDAAGNVGASAPVTFMLAAVGPTVTSLTDVTSNGNDLDAGQTVTFTLTASEALTIGAGAALTLSNGASAVYNSSSGKFVYTVVAGQDTADLKVTGYSGSITDAAGNALVPGGVILDTGIQIDTTAPAAPTVLHLGDPANGSFDAGFTVTTGAAVTVTVGGTALNPAQLAADFTKTTAGGLDTYTAKSNAFTGSEAIAVAATLTDAAGNTSGVGSLTLNPIDTTAPAAPTVAHLADPANGSFDAGFTVTAGAAVTVTVGGTQLSPAQLAADFTKSTASGLDT